MKKASLKLIANSIQGFQIRYNLIKPSLHASTRKLVVAILFLMVFKVTAVAEDRFQLGIKGGFNSTSFNTESYSIQNIKEDFKGGYMFGAFSRIRLIGNLSIQPEIYYSKKSSTSRFSVQQESIEQSIDFYSWDIPLLLHARLIDLKIFNLYGLAGPVASFRVDENRTLLGQIQDQWTTDRFREHNWNFQVGAGLEIARFNIDVRYEWGLNDMSRETLFDTKSNALLFSVGYSLFRF